VQEFYKKIGVADAVILSIAEHNGSYTAAYQNLFDWASRISDAVFQYKPIRYSSNPSISDVERNNAFHGYPFHRTIIESR
jgi:NAD(P)H-dependent FMN reductase